MMANEYVGLMGIDKGVHRIWSGQPGRYYRARLIDIGRGPDTRRPAPHDIDDDPPLAEVDEPAPTPTMRRVLESFIASDNEPATTNEIAAAIGITHNRLRNVIRAQGGLFLQEAGKRRRESGGMPETLYVAIDAASHLERQELSAMDKILRWFKANDNEPIAADELAEMLELRPEWVKAIFNQNEQFHAVGKQSGPNGGRKRKLWTVRGEA